MPEDFLADKAGNLERLLPRKMQAVAIKRLHRRNRNAGVGSRRPGASVRSDVALAPNRISHIRNSSIACDRTGACRLAAAETSVPSRQQPSIVRRGRWRPSPIKTGGSTLRRQSGSTRQMRIVGASPESDTAVTDE